MATYAATWFLDGASGVQRDIFTVTAGASKSCRILRAALYKSGDIVSEGAAWLMGFGTAGSVPTGTLGGPRNIRSSSGGTHTFSVAIGHTTLGTVAAADELWREGFNLAVGALWQASDREEFTLAPSGVWIMRMTVVPGGRNLRASILIDE